MKLFEKLKKQPVETERQPAPENTLLRTYLTSLLCMVLCVVMFLGTTYAWFTSEVNNSNNEIYIGILDVELEKQLEDLTWASLSAQTNSFNTTNLFDRNIRWEPGYTSLETVKVINKGDLAINYTLSFTDGQLKDHTDLVLGEDRWEAVIRCFDIWVYDHRANDDQPPVATSYAQITAADSGWVLAGSLADAMEGKPVFVGSITGVRDRSPATTDPTAATAATEADPELEGKYTIALHMREDADVSAMGCKIVLNVKLVAYQQGYENDHFGNNYDSLAKDTIPVYTEQQLRSALADGKTPYIANHIALTAPIKILEDTRITGGSYQLSRGEGFTGAFFRVKPDATLTLENVILEGGGLWPEDGQEETGIVATDSLITAEGNGSVILSKGTVLQNNDGFSALTLAEESSLTVSGAQILHNRAPQGAAICGGGTVILEEYSKISGNVATSGNGGAIWCEGAVTVIGGEISENTAQLQGGAIYMGAASSFRMLGGNIGGAVSLNGSEVAILGGQLSGGLTVSGAPALTLGKVELTGSVRFALNAGSNTVALEKDFAGFSFHTENVENFQFKPAEGYAYTDGDEAKLVCLDAGCTVTWDATNGVFALDTGV